MAASNKNSHLTAAERQIIETGIRNGSTKKSIADTIGKDKSTVGKEIKLHRYLKDTFSYPIDCALFRKCKHKNDYHCTKECENYKQFECKRRDRSPGACNGCSSYSRCHYDKYFYSAAIAEKEYKEQLVNSRIGVNATVNEIRELGLKIKPLLEKGQSPYVILQNHPEINLCEKTIYNYIEDGVFHDAGVPISCLDLKTQVRRKVTKKKMTEYSPRQDKSYLRGRTRPEYEAYMDENPYASVVETDTVYNDVSNGPFIQTFKFLKYDLLFCIFHLLKDSEHMRKGILLLESILGEEIFSREVMVLKMDRGSEFTLGDEIELRENGSRRTRIFYCDPMASWQKGSLENIHELLRQICPKNCDLYSLGLNSQLKADRISSNINSYPKEKLNGRTSFQLLEFFSPDMAQKLYDYGLSPIKPDHVTLKPYILKD
ncbi:MAG: helix-turn-helix domain-containing protein [Solobacterium sp.]|nr:helix-turn-helix domain-containing protein [Solobacterium sp.]